MWHLIFSNLTLQRMAWRISPRFGEWWIRMKHLPLQRALLRGARR